MGVFYPQTEDQHYELLAAHREMCTELCTWLFAFGKAGTEFMRKLSGNQPT